MEIAEYAPQTQRARIQADAVCYARAVRAREWPAMSDGHGSFAPSVWSTDFRKTFRTLQDKPVFGMLIAADNKRSDEREERLTQASASIPSARGDLGLAVRTVRGDQHECEKQHGQGEQRPYEVLDRHAGVVVLAEQPRPQPSVRCETGEQRDDGDDNDKGHEGLLR